jgi:hypothetical protein
MDNRAKKTVIIENIIEKYVFEPLDSRTCERLEQELHYAFKRNLEIDQKFKYKYVDVSIDGTKLVIKSDGEKWSVGY